MQKGKVLGGGHSLDKNSLGEMERSIGEFLKFLPICCMHN